MRGTTAAHTILTHYLGEVLMDDQGTPCGENEQFAVDMAKKMKSKIFENLCNNRKEEHQSKVGIAILFDRVGGQLTPAMRDSMAKVESIRLPVLF